MEDVSSRIVLRAIWLDGQLHPILQLVRGIMASLNELADEPRKNTRGRFEQWVKNPGCTANTLSAVLNVKLADVAKHLGYSPEYGQSPFAITRGLQFEAWLFQDNAKVIKEAMQRVKLLRDESADFIDLRLTSNGGQNVKSVDEALKKSNDLLLSLGKRANIGTPLIVAGLLLKIPKGVMLPEATLIIDVVLIHFNELGSEIKVGEIKVFPDRGGFTDTAEIATARAQAGVYQHALELTVESLSLNSDTKISKSGFLVFTWPGSNSPVIRADEDLTYQAARALAGFEKLDSLAQELVSAQSKPLKEIDFKDWIAHSETEYKETCWSFCDLAPRCQDIAYANDSAIILGSEAAKLLGVVTVTRALGLLNGQEPKSEAEQDLQRLLQAADWGVTHDDK